MGILAAERLRPTGGTTHFWPLSMRRPIVLMLKSRIQPGARCPMLPPVPPPMVLERRGGRLPAPPLPGSASPALRLVSTGDSAVSGRPPRGLRHPGGTGLYDRAVKP